jgi:hypothetical protein
MSHPTERPAPLQPAELAELIREGRAATGILPKIDRCEELSIALRRQIRLLSDEVRRRQGYEPSRQTPVWQSCERALLQAQGALCGGLGLGLRSAALHVATLAEAAEVLDGCIRASA